MASKKERILVLLVDGNALMHRAYHALPPMTTSSGELVNAVYGFTSTLLSAFEELKPTHVVVVFDAPGGSFRNTKYVEYKANRPHGDEELYQQFPRAKRVVQALNLPMLEIPGVEADDVIGTLSKTVGERNVILTGDNDALQLVDDDTKVFTFKRGVKDSMLYNAAAVEAKYGLRPDQLRDFKGLSGDTSDNIPGVPGVGPKTAAELLQRFTTLECLYDYLAKTEDAAILQAKIIRPKTLENLRAFKDQAFLSRELGTIVTDVPVPFELSAAHLADYDREQAAKLFREYEFKSLLSRLPVSSRGVGLFADVDGALDGVEKAKTRAAEATETFSLQTACSRRGVVYQNVTAATFASFLKRLSTRKIFALDTETTSLNPMDASLVGVSFSWREGEAWYLSVDIVAPGGTMNADLKTILEDGSVQKVLHNAKYDLKVLRRVGAKLTGIVSDTMVASYLLAAGTRRHTLDDLAFTEFGYEMMTYEVLVGTGKEAILITDVLLERLVFYACEDADYTWRLYERFERRISEVVAKQASVPVDLFGGTLRKGWDMRRLFTEVEVPLITVLADMELTGIDLDKKRLAKVEVSVAKRLTELDAEIRKVAGGGDFNLNAPAQLATVLFERLGLPTKGIKRTQTGFSTAATELEKLHGTHPIIALIEEYRELEKLRSTYLETLPTLIRSDTKRIHTDFNQVVAATGRLSSVNPNLQNIPVRTEVGRQVRAAFVPAKGCVFLSADYSQIDLRVLAHVSKDPEMIRLFREGKDIHTSTAAKMFGKDEADVSKDERRAAKEINFGIVYGMGPVKLSGILGISRTEAKEFIERYKETFVGVSRWREEAIDYAHRELFVETAFGRRRSLPELASGSSPLQAASERMAGNMPIQGTTADIIKIAMVRLAEQFADDPDVRMLLQVHDELLFEVPEARVDEIAAIVRDAMQNAADLDVPLVAEAAMGTDWGTLTPLK